MEHWNKIKRLLPPVLWSVFILILLKYLLPLTLPVLLGLGAAAALSPLIRKLQSGANLRHGTAAALSVTGVLLVLLLLLLLLGRFLITEMTALYSRLPGMLSSVSAQAESFGRWADRFADNLPSGIGDAFRSWAQNIMSSGGTLASGVYEWLFSAVSGFLSRLPDNLLFLLTLLLSCYFAAAELPRLTAALRERLPRQKWDQIRSLGSCVKNVLGSWLHAQIKLMGVTFLILFAGFLLLRAELPLFLALGISLLDALPLFGTGTILLPWGLFSMITGDLRFGVGLMILYGTAALCRNILEPKLLGAQLGVSPLVTLLAIYAGYRISGFLGMLLLPIIVMLTAEVLDARKHPAPYWTLFPRTAE